MSFLQNKNYSVNLKTRKCEVSALTRPFRYRGVYPQAKFDGIFNIGAVGVSGEVVAVQAWSANITGGYLTLYIYLTQQRDLNKPNIYSWTKRWEKVLQESNQIKYQNITCTHIFKMQSLQVS